MAAPCVGAALQGGEALADAVERQESREERLQPGWEAAGRAPAGTLGGQGVPMVEVPGRRFGSLGKVLAGTVC